MVIKALCVGLSLALLASGCVDPDQYVTVDAAVDAAPPVRDQAPRPDLAPVQDQAMPADAQTDAGPLDGGPDGDVATDGDVADTGPDQGPPADMAAPGPCEVSFEVALPAGTPAGTIHLAGTFYEAEGRDWQPGDAALALTREGNTARGTVSLQDGDRYEYKYTRGDWEMVEVTGACGEVANRVVRVACLDGAFAVVDVVASWQDICQ